MKSKLFPAFIALFLHLGCGSASADTISVDPAATFLLTNLDPGASSTVPIDLVALGYNAGDLIRLEQLGNFSYTIYGGLDTGTALIGLFSSSSVLLSGNNLNRVPGVIDAGANVITQPTYNGGIATDIPEDFFISNGFSFSAIQITIPTGALYLFVAAPDIIYQDNADPDGNFAVRISRVPDVGATLSLLGFTLLGLVGLRLRRA